MIKFNPLTYEVDLMQQTLKADILWQRCTEQSVKNKEEVKNAKKGTKRATKARLGEQSSAMFKEYMAARDVANELERQYYYWLLGTAEAMGGKQEHYLLMNVFPY